MSLSLGVRTSSITKASMEMERWVSVLWKGLVLVFLVIFSDQTTDVEESGTTVVFVIVPGSLPQEPDQQTASYAEDDQAGDDESSDVKTVVGTFSISREDVNGLRCHRRNGGSREGGERKEQE